MEQHGFAKLFFNAAVVLLVLMFYVYMIHRIIRVVFDGTTKPRRQTGSKP